MNFISAVINVCSEGKNFGYKTDYILIDFAGW